MNVTSLLRAPHRLRRGLATLLPAALCSAAMLVTTPAQAQLGQAAGIAESTTPEYFRRDLQIFVEGLDLDDDQRLMLEGLFEDYVADFDAGFANVQKRIEDLRPTLQSADKDEVIKLVFQPFIDWFGERDRLGAGFLENVRTILSDEQRAGWSQFERRLRREKTLGQGTLAGEKLDLFDIVRDMRLDAETADRIQPAMDAYGLALDQALRARNAALRDGKITMVQSIQEQQHAASLQTLQQQIDLRVRVRDVNLESIESIAAALPVPENGVFRSTALTKAFPRIFRPTPAERILDAALKLDGLDESVEGDIFGLQQAYLAELDPLNATLLRMTREHDPRAEIMRAEAFAARMAGERPARIEDPTRSHFQHRDEVGGTYVTLVQDMLSSEQFATLPGAARWINTNARSRDEIEAEQKRTAERAMRAKERARDKGDGAGDATSPATGTRRGG